MYSVGKDLMSSISVPTPAAISLKSLKGTSPGATFSELYAAKVEADKERTSPAAKAVAPTLACAPKIVGPNFLVPSPRAV